HLLEEVITYYLNATLPKPKRTESQREVPSTTSRYTPRAMRAELMVRSGLRCEWRGHGGRRCSSRKFLHIDHIVPLSRGGRTELKNLQVLCSAHNHLKARHDHGDSYISD